MLGAGRGRPGTRRPRPNRRSPPPVPARAGRAARPAPVPRPAARRLRPRAPRALRPPAPAAPAPSPHPFILSGAWRGPANPRPHVSALAARPACAALPASLREPGDVGRAWGRLCLPFSCFFFFSFPPFPSAGLTDQSERRWRRTRNLGCRRYCSPWAPERAFPCPARGVRIIFLFWKLKSAPRVGDY